MLSSRGAAAASLAMRSLRYHIRATPLPIASPGLRSVLNANANQSVFRGGRLAPSSSASSASWSQLRSALSAQKQHQLCLQHTPRAHASFSSLFNTTPEQEVSDEEIESRMSNTEDKDHDNFVTLQCNGPDSTVVVIRLDRPDKLNALSVELGNCLLDALKSLTEYFPKLRCVILTGSGRAFSAGGDVQFLHERLETEPEQNSRIMLDYYNVFLGVRKLNVPVIAAINGHAVGAGLCLALACDLRIAAQGAKLGVNFAKLGIHAGMASTHFLPQLIGMQQASRMLLTGQLLDAQEAEEIGLVMDVYPEDQLMDEAQKLANQIAANSPIAVRTTLQTLRNRMNVGLDAALQREADAQAQTYAAPDLAEGLRAIAEKRAPNYTVSDE